MKDSNKFWQSPKTFPPLQANQVHLWLCSLAAPPEQLKQAKTVLNKAELARAAKFVSPMHQRRYTMTRFFLRTILGSYLDLNPKKIHFEQNDYGKLYLPNKPLQFNLSKSEEFAVYAFANNIELGIDIEYLCRKVNRDNLITHSFSQAEQQQYAKLPEHLRLKSFFQGWTSKEAIIKAIGTGLSTSLRSFTIEMDPTKPVNLISSTDDFPSKEPWFMQSIPSPENFAITLATNASKISILGFSNKLLA